MISLVGDDTIVFASDYPHPDAIFPGAVRALSERTDLDAADNPQHPRHERAPLLRAVTAGHDHSHRTRT